MRKRAVAEIDAGRAAGHLLKQDQDGLVRIPRFDERYVKIALPMHGAKFRGVLRRRLGDANAPGEE